jgi:uncharacterized protein (DUF302 family)
MTAMLDRAYSFSRTLPGVSHAAAVERATAALKEQGFGVLTTIDMRATLKAKLDVDFRDYVILGACNPPIAWQAVQAEPAVGLFLPCNVVVTVDDAGDAVVALLDPASLLAAAGNPEGLRAPMADARRRLTAALESL